MLSCVTVPQCRNVLQFLEVFQTQSRKGAVAVLYVESVCPATPLTRPIVLKGRKIPAKTHESTNCVLAQLLSKHYVVQLLFLSYLGCSLYCCFNCTCNDKVSVWRHVAIDSACRSAFPWSHRILVRDDTGTVDVGCRIRSGPTAALRKAKSRLDILVNRQPRSVLLGGKASDLTMQVANLPRY